jgi:hypothetical protein
LNKPVRTVPEVKPDWVDKNLSTSEEWFFVGKSPRKYAAELEAENAAREEAFTRAMSFYGELLQTQAFEKPIPRLADLLSRETEISGYARSVVSQTGTDNRYTEIYRNEKNQDEYIVYLLYAISRREAAERIQTFTDNLSRSYSSRLSPPQSLWDALVMYDEVLANLGQNSLHRAIAYNEGSGEKRGLYQYLSAETDRLVNGLSFESLPVLNIQKTDLLEVSLRVDSKSIESVGAINAQFCIYDQADTPLLAPSQVLADSGNRFSLQIPTVTLAPGSYTLRAELLLKEVANKSNQISRNTTGEFFFNVTPVNAIIQFAGEQLVDMEKNILTERIREALKNNAVPVQIVPEAKNIQNRYSVIVTVNIGILPPLPQLNTLESAFWDITLVFMKNDMILKETERRRTTLSRTNSDKIFPQVADYVRDNKSFFQDINTAVTQ